MSDEPAQAAPLSRDDGPVDQLAVLAALCARIAELRDEGLALEADFEDALAAIPGDHRVSGRNLLHYLAVRRHDLRVEQDQLADLGLSSLGRMEAHVQATLDAVATALAGLAGALPPDPGACRTGPPTIEAGRGLLEEHADRLLGPPAPGRAGSWSPCRPRPPTTRRWPTRW